MEDDQITTDIRESIVPGGFFNIPKYTSTFIPGPSQPLSRSIYNMSGWKSLNVGVIGGGIGGMSVAVALRRAGHHVTIYEKSDFAGEVGASVSCAANGTRWLHEWKVDVAKGDPVVLKKLINRDWKTGEPVSVYDLDDYEKRWGYAYNMFHRQYMHAMLKDSALGEGEGVPATLKVNHKV
jgi:salicylate hydroxylase